MPQATKTAAEPAAAPAPVAAAKASKETGSASPASAPATSQQPTELSIESIGWLFLQKYYGSYTADLSKLYAFYDANASISHESFPSENTDESDPEAGSQHRTKTVNVAQGTEAVRAFYEGHAGSVSSSAAKNKIVVENATFQKSVADSILIVVSGSWKRGSSHLWQFVQTFVLHAKGKTVYDIANDVLQFIDLAEDHKETSTKVNVVEEKPASKADTTASASAASNEEKPAEKAEASPEKAQKSDSVPEAASNAAAEPKSVVPETHTEEPAVTVDTESAKEEAAAAPEATEAAPAADSTSAETGETPAASEVEKSSEQEKPAAPAVPAVKPTWANLAAIGPKTAPKNGAVAVAAPIATKVAAPPAAAAAAAAPALAAKKAASPAQTASAASAASAASQAAANGKYKKEEWYPIYIKNVDVEEEELKTALVKQFGDIKFFKKTNKTALCDFRSKEDQQKALETREMVVKSNVILLEPRIHKTFNNAKPEAKKDKKHLKKNGFKKN